VKKKNPYETDRYLDEYLLFHYGDCLDLCPFEFVPRSWLKFHECLRTECVLPHHSNAKRRALDLGCGVGRFSFELGLIAEEVVGIDYSKSFIGAARRIAARQLITVNIFESGKEIRKAEVVLPRNLRKANVRFDTGDAMDLDRWAGDPFQIVAAINLLCRLPSPRKFLRNVHALVAPGGQLLLASPYSWLEQYTPRREWLTSKAVPGLMQKHFKLGQRCDVPFVIREHRRKYQLVISEVLTFIRK
jgi:SAM-dependent methyltransferase